MTRLRIERLNPSAPMTLRARIWSDGVAGQVEQLTALLLAIVPDEPGHLALGTRPQDPGYVESLGGLVGRDQLHEILRRCAADNLQLSWPAPSPRSELEVIAELYDDHIEVFARPPYAENVERAIAAFEAGAS